MEELTAFVKVGKNTHDDAADSLSQLVAFIEGEDAPVAECKAIFNPFRRGNY